MNPGTLIGFADEMRVGLRGMVRRVWGVRGVKVVQRLQLVYEWKYLFLVVDFVRGRLEWAWMDSMDSETVARAVVGMRRHTQVRALVWDGASSHRSEWVRSVVGVTTVVQPAYSPRVEPCRANVRGSAEVGGGQSVREHRGEGGGGERLPEQTGIRPRTGQVAGGLGLDQAERSGADCRLRGLIKLKRYKLL